MCNGHAESAVNVHKVRLSKAAGRLADKNRCQRVARGLPAGRPKLSVQVRPAGFRGRCGRTVGRH